MTQRRALILMVACLLLAAALRLVDLSGTPPGLHYDEAANAILSADIGLRGDRPIFITSYTGKEPLYFYLAGGIMRLVGESVFSLRLTSAFLGLLTVAATYWLGRELLADRRIAVLAAALLAVAFWHVLLSRLGFRAISQPLLQALAVAALFRGLKRWQWTSLIVGGIFMGFTAYTYLAARIFPLLLLIALVPLLLDRQNGRQRFGQIAVFGTVALVVAAPLLLFFLNTPSAFWVRIVQVAPDSQNPNLLESYLQTLGMFFLVGDPYWRFNIPYRALLNWFWGGLLLVGWVTLLIRWRGWWYDWQKSAVTLLLLTPLIMILPSSLAINEIVPSNLRAIGLLPFILFLPSLGLVRLLEQLANLVRQPDHPITQALQRMRVLEGFEVNYALVVLIALVAGAIGTGRAYFDEWATRADLFYENDSDLVAVAEHLEQREPADETLFVSALHYRHPTLAFVTDSYDQIKWLLDGAALVLPAEAPARYFYPHSSPAPGWALPFLSEPVDGPLGPDGEPIYTSYQVGETPEVKLPFEVNVDFGNTLRLVGYNLEDAASGMALPLTLVWEVLRGPMAGVQPFIHLEDETGRRWSQVEPSAYPSEQWTAGETIIQRVDVPLPHGIPPAFYRLRVGLFDSTTGERLPRLDAAGRYAGDSYLVESARVVAGAPPEELPEAPLGEIQQVGPGLQLLGYERAAETIGQGERLPLALWWYATQPQPDMLVRLELIRPDGTGRILQDTRPVRGNYPFEAWRPPQFVIDYSAAEIPPNFPPGAYSLFLRLLDARSNTVFTSNLGPVTIVETRRSFSLPELDRLLEANFGNEIRLAGFQVDELAPGSYHLTLGWQALGKPSADYTAFVHLLDSDGTCCLWQADRFPGRDALPTSRWLPGQVVTDTYEIVLPDGTLPTDAVIEVGLYLAESGQRIAVQMPGREADDKVLLPAAPTRP